MGNETAETEIGTLVAVKCAGTPGTFITALGTVSNVDTNF